MFPEIARKFLQERDAGTLQPEALLPPTDMQEPAREGVPTEFNIDVHGEQHDVVITGVGTTSTGRRRVFLTLNGSPEEIIVDTLSSYQPQGGQSKRAKATQPGHISTAMPGNIVEVLVEVGQHVEAGAALLISEAMKMETEIQAAISGTVVAVHVSKGDRVTPGDILIEIE